MAVPSVKQFDSGLDGSDFTVPRSGVAIRQASPVEFQHEERHMRSLIPVSAVAGLLIALLTIHPGYSDDADKPAKKVPSQKTVVAKAAPEKSKAQTTKRKKPRGRLPNNYAKIGISKKQREEIYALQAAYASQLDELKKQMAALVAKRDSEVEAVLTDAQKKQLGELREATKKRASERSRKSAAKKTANSTK